MNYHELSRIITNYHDSNDYIKLTKTFFNLSFKFLIYKLIYFILKNYK